MNDYLKNKILDAQKPEALAKAGELLAEKMSVKKGLSSEDICRFLYGNEVVDLWKTKENHN